MTFRFNDHPNMYSLVWPLLEQLFLAAIDTGNIQVAEVCFRSVPMIVS
jgi:hypothetical protein